MNVVIGTKLIYCIVEGIKRSKEDLWFLLSFYWTLKVGSPIETIKWAFLKAVPVPVNCHCTQIVQEQV